MRLFTNITIAIMVAFLLTANTFGLPAKPADYSGNWTLDFKQSIDLPPFYSNIRSHKLTITQTKEQLRVNVAIETKEGTPVRISLPYSLDGSEVKTKMPVRGPQGDVMVPTTLKATVSSDGSVRILISREMGPDLAVTAEDWSLSNDGKTLTIHRTDDTPRGKIDAQMIFVKS